MNHHAEINAKLTEELEALRSKFSLGGLVVIPGGQIGTVLAVHYNTLTVRVGAECAQSFRLQDVAPYVPPVQAASWPDQEPSEVEAQAQARERKARPLARGCLAFFPDALAAVSNVSLVATAQHHPGEPIYWEADKSTDHADCLLRHLTDAGTTDTDGLSHTAKVAWRALALLQTELESENPELHARRQAQRDAAKAGK